MRVICSYCRTEIRADPKARVTDVSHGMCEPCARHFERLWAGIPLGEYLDDLPSPVLIVDGDARVVAMNQKLIDLLGADRTGVVGLKGGEAFACVRSRLPEGCGGTVRCRECTIRRTVEEVARTGRAKEHVRAYLNRADGRLDLRISAKPGHCGAIQVTIEEMGPPRSRPSDA